MEQSFSNPYRPGAGHPPPYLAGREDEKHRFSQLLNQHPVLRNVVLTGLRGIGKTVLLEEFQKMAGQNGWVWVGSDLSESSGGQTEENLARRIITDLSVVTSQMVMAEGERQEMGFAGGKIKTAQRLDSPLLEEIYRGTPGLALDKLKTVLEVGWSALMQKNGHKGIVFAYDEAQNLADNRAKDEYPLALLLDTFQALQRKNLPLLLVLTGLPTLFPKLVEARAYAERMFEMMELGPLDEAASRKAILKPLDIGQWPVRFTDESVATIVDRSSGYPYFIQFICREIYNAWTEDANVPVALAPIIEKLDRDFFSGRWDRATDRQRDFMRVIAGLDSADDEFTVQEVVQASEHSEEIKAFSASHAAQMLNNLIDKGLVYRNRHGRYSFAVPLLAGFIRRWRG